MSACKRNASETLDLPSSKRINTAKTIVSMQCDIDAWWVGTRLTVREDVDFWMAGVVEEASESVFKFVAHHLSWRFFPHRDIAETDFVDGKENNIIADIDIIRDEIDHCFEQHMDGKQAVVEIKIRQYLRENTETTRAELASILYDTFCTTLKDVVEYFDDCDHHTLPPDDTQDSV